MRFFPAISRTLSLIVNAALICKTNVMMADWYLAGFCGGSGQFVIECPIGLADNRRGTEAGLIFHAAIYRNVHNHTSEIESAASVEFGAFFRYLSHQGGYPRLD